MRRNRRQTLVVDLLPAGFEIETATVSKGRSTTGLFLAAGADRTRPIPSSATTASSPRSTCKNGASDFTLAYVVRAVTPGEFKYPALVAEDMYEPETAGRTAIGKLTVGAAVSPRSTLAAAGEVRSHSRPACGGGERTRASGRVRGWLRRSAVCRRSPCARSCTSSISLLPPPALDRSRSAVGSRAGARRVDPARLSDADGKWRLPVEADKVDPLYRRMLIAAEDRRFRCASRRRPARRRCAPSASSRCTATSCRAPRR